VGEAVGQMDQATQQNAALVEESAAAADSLRQQAQQLVQAVAVFQLGGAQAIRTPVLVKKVAAPVAAPRAGNVVKFVAKPVRPAAAAPMVAAGGSEQAWTSF
ncbi:MAG: methyl-accepting chemotaxis protein, partial [Burkholderiaceae bacterium]|nr:methyl-accepting chemotaxis protein [Burkholderiaceae bacterium]